MTQYLILHKVRGKPAFEVAEQIQIGDEEGWIIPTSGHRAYPVGFIEVKHLLDVSERNALDEMVIRNFMKVVNGEDPFGPNDTRPDHYQISRHEPKQELDIGSLLSGLMPKGKFLRRA